MSIPNVNNDYTKSVLFVPVCTQCGTRNPRTYITTRDGQRCDCGGRLYLVMRVRVYGEEAIQARAQLHACVSSALRARMAELDVTQKVFGEMLGINGNQISKVLSGETGISLERLSDFAFVLGCQVRIVLSDEFQEAEVLGVAGADGCACIAVDMGDPVTGRVKP